MVWKPTPKRIKVRGKVYTKPRSTWNGMIRWYKANGYDVILKNAVVYIRRKRR